MRSCWSRLCLNSGSALVGIVMGALSKRWRASMLSSFCRPTAPLPERIVESVATIGDRNRELYHTWPALISLARPHDSSQGSPGFQTNGSTME